MIVTGGYSNRSKQIARERIEQLKEHNQHEIVARKERRKELSKQTNDIRRKLENKKKSHEQREEERRQKIIKSRKLKQQVATEKFQRNSESGSNKSKPKQQDSKNGLTDGKYNVRGGHVIEIRDGVRVSSTKQPHQQESTYDFLNEESYLKMSPVFQNSLYAPNSYLSSHLNNLLNENVIKDPAHKHPSISRDMNIDLTGNRQHPSISRDMNIDLTGNKHFFNFQTTIHNNMLAIKNVGENQEEKYSSSTDRTIETNSHETYQNEHTEYLNETSVELRSPTDSLCNNDSLTDINRDQNALRSSLKGSSLKLNQSEVSHKKVTFSDSIEFNDGNVGSLKIKTGDRIPLYKRMQENNLVQKSEIGTEFTNSSSITTTNPPMTTEGVLDRLREEALMPRHPQNGDFNYPDSVIIPSHNNVAVVTPLISNQEHNKEAKQNGSDSFKEILSEVTESTSQPSFTSDSLNSLSTKDSLDLTKIRQNNESLKQSLIEPVDSLAVLPSENTRSLIVHPSEENKTVQTVDNYLSSKFDPTFNIVSAEQVVNTVYPVMSMTNVHPFFSETYQSNSQSHHPTHDQTFNEQQYGQTVNGQQYGQTFNEQQYGQNLNEQYGQYIVSEINNEQDGSYDYQTRTIQDANINETPKVPTSFTYPTFQTQQVLTEAMSTVSNDMSTNSYSQLNSYAKTSHVSYLYPFAEAASMQSQNNQNINEHLSHREQNVTGYMSQNGQHCTGYAFQYDEKSSVSNNHNHNVAISTSLHNETPHNIMKGNSQQSQNSTGYPHRGNSGYIPQNNQYVTSHTPDYRTTSQVLGTELIIPRDPINQINKSAREINNYPIRSVVNATPKKEKEFNEHSPKDTEFTSSNDEVYNAVERHLAGLTFDSSRKSINKNTPSKDKIHRPSNFPKGDILNDIENILEQKSNSAQNESDKISNAVKDGSSIPIRIHSTPVRRGRIIVSADSKKRRQISNYTPHPPAKPKNALNNNNSNDNTNRENKNTILLREKPPIETPSKPPTPFKRCNSTQQVKSQTSPAPSSVPHNVAANGSQQINSKRSYNPPYMNNAENYCPKYHTNNLHQPTSSSSSFHENGYPNTQPVTSTYHENRHIASSRFYNGPYTNNVKIALNKTPTDEEINKLWANVRECLHSETPDHAYSDSVCVIDMHPRKHHQRTYSGSSVNRRSNQKGSLNTFPASKYIDTSPRQLHKKFGSHEILFRQNSNDSMSSTSTYNKRQALLPHRASKVITNSAVSNERKLSSFCKNENSQEDRTVSKQEKHVDKYKDVSASMASFLALEELCAQQSLTPRQTEAVFQASKSLQKTPGMSALSIEERRVTESLERLNERLKEQEYYANGNANTSNTRSKNK